MNENKDEVITKLRKALDQIAKLEKRADDSVGFVDNAHIKALRAASKIAKETLEDTE